MPDRRAPDGAWDGHAGAITDELFGAGPEAARLLLNVLDRYARAERVSFPPKVAHLRRGLMRVSGTGIYGHRSQAASGHADTADAVDGPSSDQWITTAEAADLLEVTERHCRRLAEVREEFGLARKVRGSWWIQKDEVAALAAEKRRSA